MSMTTTVVASHDGDMADHDPARPRRRRFSPEYKLAILAEYDRLTEPGDKGALLRREGLYTSHIVEWRRAREAGALAGLAGQGRARKRVNGGGKLTPSRQVKTDPWLVMVPRWWPRGRGRGRGP